MLPPSPPAEHAECREHQAGQARTSDGAGYSSNASAAYEDNVRSDKMCEACRIKYNEIELDKGIGNRHCQRRKVYCYAARVKVVTSICRDREGGIRGGPWHRGEHPCAKGVKYRRNQLKGSRKSWVLSNI